MRVVNDSPNQRIIPDKGDYCISYNPLVNNGNGETAIVTMNVKNYSTPQYFILNGDWRKQYKEVVDKGLEACMAVFEDNKDEHISIWSNE